MTLDHNVNSWRVKHLWIYDNLFQRLLSLWRRWRMNCWSISTFRAFIGLPDGNTFVVRIMFLSVVTLKKLLGKIMSKGVLYFPELNHDVTHGQVWVQATLSKRSQELEEELQSLPSRKTTVQEWETFSWEGWWDQFPSEALVLYLLYPSSLVIRGINVLVDFFFVV